MNKRLTFQDRNARHNETMNVFINFQNSGLLFGLDIQHWNNLDYHFDPWESFDRFQELRTLHHNDPLSKSFDWNRRDYSRTKLSRN